MNLADLSVIKTHSPPTPVVGQPLTYTVTVTNNGPSAATGVSIVDTLPASVLFVSANDVACVNNSGTVTCSNLTLANGASVAIDIVVTPTAAQMITNNVTVSSAATDLTPANNTAQDAVLVSAFGTCASPTFYVAEPDSFGQASSSNWFTTGDFNGDTNPDAAIIVNRTAANRVIAVMLGDGSGGFTPGTDFVLNGTGARIVSGEFTGDAHLDLAVVMSAVPSIGTGVQILRGTGTGTFTADPVIAIGGQPSYIETGDLNHDNHLDLVVGGFSTGVSASVLIANGSGGFTVSSLGQAIDDGIQIVDFDLDTHPDIVVLTQDLHGVRVMKGDGLGGFTPAALLTVPDFLSSLVNLGDINGDSYPDLAIGNAPTAPATLAGVSLVLNDGAGGLQAPTQLLAPFSQQSSRVLNVGEVNGDGRPDLILMSRPSGGVLIMLGDGAGGFAAPVSYLVDNPGRAIVADVNHDQRSDILVISQNDGWLYALLNTCNLGSSADLVRHLDWSGQRKRWRHDHVSRDGHEQRTESRDQYRG